VVREGRRFGVCGKRPCEVSARVGGAAQSGAAGCDDCSRTAKGQIAVVKGHFDASGAGERCTSPAKRRQKGIGTGKEIVK